MINLENSDNFKSWDEEYADKNGTTLLQCIWYYKERHLYI